MAQIISVYGMLLLKALGKTLLLALLGLAFGCVLGIVFGMLSVVKNKACNIISTIYVNIIRGVPMLVLAMFVYFGVPYALNNFFHAGMTLTGLQAGTICLALNCGAYMSEIIRAGIQSIDVGQMEAARSLGLTYWRGMFRVVLPQAIRNMIPSIVNQFIITLKDTSILSVIGMAELVNKAKQYVGSTYQFFATYILVAAYYLVIISVLMIVSKLVEKKLKYGRQ